MRTSDKTGELAKSLFAFQRDLTPPRTDSTADTGKFSYDYLSLPGLFAHCRPLLNEWGLVVLQEGVELPGGIGVTTRVIHAPSDEWIELGPLFLPATGSPQNFGSAYTYGRRYGFTAALGIATADDDAASATVEPRSTVTGSSEATGMAKADGSGAPASGPSSEALAYGEGASTPDAGGVGRPDGQVGAESDESAPLAITVEQMNTLLKEAGGVRKAKAASKEMYGKEYLALTVDEALKLIQQLQALKEAS